MCVCVQYILWHEKVVPGFDLKFDWLPGFLGLRT